MTDTLRRSSRIRFTGQLNWNPRKRRRSREQDEVYPLGITGINSRFEAELNTTADDPWRAFLLYPPEFNNIDAQYARRSWMEEIYFLEGDSGGDGKLELRREIVRDRSIAGGEKTTLDLILLRLRLNLAPGLRAQAIPLWKHNLRRGLIFSEKRSDVTGSGGELGLTFRQPNDIFEYGLAYGYEQRRDKVTNIGIIERKITPRFTWNIGLNGAARVEGSWRKLTSDVKSPGYDLAQSWYVGDNYTLDISIDYNLGANVTATAYFHGLWRGDNRPVNSGLIEFTAKL